jgi:hypothetical protein
VGRGRIPSLLPLGQALPRPQARTRGVCPRSFLISIRAQQIQLLLIGLSLGVFFWLQERAALAASDPNRYVEKRKPIPDSQVLLKRFSYMQLKIPEL